MSEAESPPENREKQKAVDMDSLARKMADNLADEIADNPRDYALCAQSLEDLKLRTAREAAEIHYADKFDVPRPDEAFIWNLAQDMPPFKAEALYQKRTSLISIGAAVFLGWLAGGLLATLLGFLGMGGEILRPLAIFGIIWLGEYLGANPRARNILLTALGLGGLARFAASAAAGFVRFATFGNLRQAIFGSAAMPNIFKSAWLFMGAFFVFIFLAKKITGLDIAAFRQDMAVQIKQRIKLAEFIFSEIDQRNAALEACRAAGAEASENSLSIQKNRDLAIALISVLDSLNPATRHFLREKLAAAGYEARDPETDFPIWNSKEHEGLYDTIGLINDGDHFRVLKKAYKDGGRMVKGHAQRVAPERARP